MTPIACFHLGFNVLHMIFIVYNIIYYKDSTKNCPSINVFKSRLNLNIIHDKPTLFLRR